MSSSISTRGGWLDQLERDNSKSHELWELPEALTDVFSSELQRLTATLDSYRHTTEPRPLMDWAVIQTGMDDPLSKYTRHDLEQAFARFARNRDQHLLALVKQLKKAGQHQVLVQARHQVRVLAGQSALDRAMRH